jgi:hypothetical protein
MQVLCSTRQRKSTGTVHSDQQDPPALVANSLPDRAVTSVASIRITIVPPRSRSATWVGAG